MGLLTRLRTKFKVNAITKRVAKKEAIKHVDGHGFVVPKDLRAIMIKRVYRAKLKELRAAQRTKK